MRPLSYYIPKILLPVRGKPVLDHLMSNIEGLNVETHYVVASEHTETIEKYVKQTKMDNVKLLRGLSWETGGDLSLALEQVEPSGDVVVMNGDLVTDIRMAPVYKDHAKLGQAYVTMAVFRLKDPAEASRFGRISFGPGSMISRFAEKSAKDGGGVVNSGLYVFDRELIKRRKEYLSPRKFKLEVDLFPRLAEERRLRGSMVEPGYWWDVGTIDSYLRAEDFFSERARIIPP
jgi:NDP-sugar pyrophosphorylase family protein